MKIFVFTVAIVVLLTSTSVLAGSLLDSNVLLDPQIWSEIQTWEISPAKNGSTASLMLSGRTAQFEGQNYYFAQARGSLAVATQQATKEAYRLWLRDQPVHVGASADYYYLLAIEFMSKVKIFQLTTGKIFLTEEEKVSRSRVIIAVIGERYAEDYESNLFRTFFPENTTVAQMTEDAIWRLNWTLDILGREKRYNSIPAGSEFQLELKFNGYVFNMVNVLYPDYREEDYK